MCVSIDETETLECMAAMYNLLPHSTASVTEEAEMWLGSCTSGRTVVEVEVGIVVRIGRRSSSGAVHRAGTKRRPGPCAGRVPWFW